MCPILAHHSTMTTSKPDSWELALSTTPPQRCHSWSVHASQTGDIPSAPGSSGQGGLHFGLYGSETIGETVLGRLPPPGHCTNNNWNTPPSFCEKGLSTWPAASAWQACFHTSRNYGGALRECRWGIPSLSSHLALLQLTSTAEKKAHTLRVQSFQLSLRGHLQITGSGGQQDLWLLSHRTMYICLP